MTFVASTTPDITEALPGCVVRENAPAVLGGQDAYRMVYTWQPEGMPEMTRLQYFVVRGPVLVVVLTEMFSDAYPSLGATVEQVIQGTQFVETA